MCLKTTSSITIQLCFDKNHSEAIFGNFEQFEQVLLRIFLIDYLTYIRHLPFLFPVVSIIDRSSFDQLAQPFRLNVFEHVFAITFPKSDIEISTNLATKSFTIAFLGKWKFTYLLTFFMSDIEISNNLATKPFGIKFIILETAKLAENESQVKKRVANLHIRTHSF